MPPFRRIWHLGNGKLLLYPIRGGYRCIERLYVYTHEYITQDPIRYLIQDITSVPDIGCQIRYQILNQGVNVFTYPIKGAPNC